MSSNQGSASASIQSQYRPIAVFFLLIIVLSTGFGAVGIAGGDTQSDISITGPETVAPNGTFEFTVNTTASAGTIVEANSESGTVVLSNTESDQVNISDNRVEFIDPDLGDSQYTISVNHSGGTSGDTIEVSSWVNAAKQSEADATDTKIITVQESVSITDTTIVPKKVNSAQEHNVSFKIKDLSADSNQDNISVKFPDTVKLKAEPSIIVNGNSIDKENIKKQDNTVKFSVNQSQGEPTEAEVKINVVMSKIN